MSLSFKEVCAELRTKGFLMVTHPIVKHHLMKDFEDYDVTNARFYIKQVGSDYLHVAVIEHTTAQASTAVQLRYSCAGDDLLYGLRVKFNSGGNNDNKLDLSLLGFLSVYKSLTGESRYIRKRFRHGRTKAKVRALFVYLRDQWKILRTGDK